jgi:hypothetical protein
MDPQTPAQDAPVTPVTEPINPSIKPQNKWVVSIVFLVVGILIGVGGILAYQKFAAVKPVATVTSSPTPGATTESAGDWKTYADKTNKYSIRYPSDWTKSNNAVAFTDPTNSFALSIEIKQTKQNVTEYMTNKCIVGGTDFCSGSISGPIPGSIQYSHPKSQYDSIETLWSLEGNMFDFSLDSINPNQSADQATKQIYNQVLSTFTYSSQTLGSIISGEYSIQIPSFWDGKYVKQSIGNCDYYNFIGKNMYYNLFSICKTTSQLWADALNENVPGGASEDEKLAENNNYVYFYGSSIDNPYTGDEGDSYHELSASVYATILKSFKLN